jgi:hypothetical protein
LPVALWAVCGIVTLSPLLGVRIPPLVDYPNHLARIVDRATRSLS